MPSLHDILDLPPEGDLPKPLKLATTKKSKREALIAKQQIEHRDDAPQTYKDACEYCKPKEIEWMNLVLAGKGHAEAAAEVYGLGKKAARNRANVLYARTPRVMVALALGHKEVASRVDYTVDASMERLDAMIAEARGRGQIAAAVAAEKLKLELAGHIKQKNPAEAADFRIIIQNTGQPTTDE